MLSSSDISFLNPCIITIPDKLNKSKKINFFLYFSPIKHVNLYWFHEVVLLSLENIFENSFCICISLILWVLNVRGMKRNKQEN
jgi:hypothetical protein